MNSTYLTNDATGWEMFDKVFALEMAHRFCCTTPCTLVASAFRLGGRSGGLRLFQTDRHPMAGVVRSMTIAIRTTLQVILVRVRFALCRVDVWNKRDLPVEI